MRTGADLAAIRERKPLVHQITNYVVMNETANATLALGALPVMAHAVEEVEEMASVAGALVLNIGTLSEHWIEAMLLAAKAANAAGVPVVLDPVGAGATRLRTETAKRILDEAEIAVVRGNAAEVATLAGREAEIRGVESIGAADSGARAGEGRRLGARVRRLRHGPGRPRLRRRAHDRGRERRRAARHGQRHGLHVDGDHRLLPRRCVHARSRPRRRRSSRSASPVRTRRWAPRGRARSTSLSTTRSTTSTRRRSTRGRRSTE